MSFLLALETAAWLIWAPMTGQNALAAIASSGPMRLEAEYEAITPLPWLGRHKTASASFTVDISATRYSIEMDSRAEGVWDWFADVSAAMDASGAVTPRGLFPGRFTSSVQDGPKHRRVLVDFTPREVMVSVSPRFGDWGTPIATQSQMLEAVDPLTAILNLTLRTKATSSNPCGGPLRVFDGKQRYDLRLAFQRRVQWNADVYTGPALICAAELIEIAGFDARSAQQKAEDKADIEWANLVLAELDGGAVTPPLKAEVRSRRSGKYTYQATKLRYGRAG